MVADTSYDIHKLITDTSKDIHILINNTSTDIHDLIINTSSNIHNRISNVSTDVLNVSTYAKNVSDNLKTETDNRIKAVADLSTFVMNQDSAYDTSIKDYVDKQVRDALTTVINSSFTDTSTKLTALDNKIIKETEDRIAYDNVLSTSIGTTVANYTKLVSDTSDYIMSYVNTSVFNVLSTSIGLTITELTTNLTLDSSSINTSISDLST